MAPSVTSLVPSFDPSGNVVGFNANPQQLSSSPFLSPPLPPPVSMPNSTGNQYHIQESLFQSLPVSSSSCWSGRNVEQIMAFEQDSSWTGGRSSAEDDTYYYRLPITTTPDGLMGRLLNDNVGISIDPWKPNLPPPNPNLNLNPHLHPHPPPVNSFSHFDPQLSGFINPTQLMGYSGKLISDGDRRNNSIIGTTNMILPSDASNAMINSQKNYLAEGIGVDRLRSAEDAQIGDENSVVIPTNSAVSFRENRKPGDAAETEEVVTVNSQDEEGSCYQRETVSTDVNSSKKRKCGSRDLTKSNKEFKTDAETVDKCKRTKSYQEAAAADKSGPKEELLTNKASNPSEPRKQIQTSNSGTSGESDSKPTASDQPPTKPDYIHVRARRGQATDSHSLAERVRREKISERMKLLQDLVPGCNKVTGKAMMLDEIINYVQSLQRQVEFLSMKLAAVNPRLDYYNIENLLLNKEVLPNRTPGGAFGAEVLPPPPYPSLPSTCTATTNTSQTSLLLQQQKKIVNNMPGGAELAAPLSASIATAAVSSATHPSIRSMMMMAPNSFHVADHNPSPVQQVWGGDELHHVVQHMGGRGPFPLVSEPSSSSSGLVGTIAAALKAEM